MIRTYLVTLNQPGQAPQTVSMLGRSRQSALLAARELYPEASIQVRQQGEW